MAEETPLERAIREAKEKTAQKAKGNNPYKDMDYETYIAQKESGVKKKASPVASPSISQTSGTPSPISQVPTNADSVNPLVGGNTLNDLIPEEKRNQITQQVNTEQAPITPDFNDLDRITSINEKIQNDKFKSFISTQNTPFAKSMLETLNKKDAEWESKSPLMRMQARYDAAGGRDKYEKLQSKLSTNAVEEDKQLKEEVRQQNKYENSGFGTDFENSTARYIRGGLGQLVGSASKTLTESASGIANISRDLGGKLGDPLPSLYDDQGNKTDYAKKSHRVIDQLILGLDGHTDMSNAMLANETLPDETGGRFVTQAAHIAPDIAALIFAPETKAAEGVGLLYKAKTLVWNPFTKYMIAKSALSGYSGEKKKGADMTDAVVGAAKGATEGAVTGATVGILGGVAGKISKTVTNDLIRSGLIGIDNHLTKAGIRAVSESMTFGSAPIIEAYGKSIATGEDIDRKDTYNKMIDGLAMGGAFGLKAGIGEYKNSVREYKDYRELIDVGLPKMQENAFANFLRADIQTIGKVATSINDAGDLHAKGIELIANSAKEHVEAKRNEMLANAVLNTKLADIKGVTEVIVNNKQELIDFINKSEIAPEAKQMAIDKINSVHDLLSDTGATKEMASKTVEESVTAADELSERLANATTPQEVAEIKAQAEQVVGDGISATQTLNNESAAEVSKSNDVSDVDFTNFKKQGIVDQDLIDRITQKVTSGASLTERERQVYENDRSEDLSADNTSVKPLKSGDQINFKDANENTIDAFVKEVLLNGKLIVATVQDGIYKEQTINTPEEYKERKPESIKSTVEPKETPTVIQNSVDVQPTEFDGKTPDELATMYNEEVNAPSLTNVESAIADMPFFINRESYGDAGDKRNITASKARSYFKKGAMSIDQVAKEINDTKFEGNEVVTPNDIIEFIDKFPNGPQTVRQPSANPRLRQINDAYFEQTRKKLNQRSAQEIVDASLEVIEKASDKQIDDIETELTRLIDSEGITLNNIDALQEQLEFVYGEDAFNDIKAQLIFENNGTESGNDSSGQTPLDTAIANAQSSGDTPEIATQEGTGGAKVEPTTGNPERTGANGNDPGTERIASTEQSVADTTTRVVELQRELGKLQESLNKNLKENQSNLFGENKTQSLFDDKAAQQKIVTDKAKELLDAQTELAKFRQELADAKEADGQVSLELPESKVEIDGKEVDLAKTSGDADAKIIMESSINPFKLISFVQKNVDKLETAIFEKYTTRLTDAIAERMKAWRTSKSTAKQWASSLASSVLGGVARSSSDINVKLGLIGGKNMAIHNMGKIMKSLYSIVDGNTESLERIHVVLDPDFYQQGLGGQADLFKSKFSIDPSVKRESSNIYDTNKLYQTIGTKQDYQDYIASIFPDSKVKNVLYHGAQESMIPGDGKFKGFVTYLSTDKKYSETFGFPVNRKVISVIVDVKKPFNSKAELADVPLDTHEKGEFTNARLVKSNNPDKYDAVIGVDAGQKDGETIVVFNPENIHILGGILDEQGFRNYVKNKPDSPIKNVPPNLAYADLTAEEKQLFDEIRNNLDDIHFKNFALGFISQDVFDKYKGTYVPRMYETFELPTEVQEALDSYQDQIGDKLNLNPFKKRKGLDALSDESKNAVLKDPVYLMAKRMMELDTNSAIMTYLNHINRNTKDLVHVGTDKIPVNFVKLDGKAYGTLNGKYVASFVAEDLRGYMFVNKQLNQIYDVLKGYDRTWARKGIKKGLTVLNPFVQLGNFTSNVVFAQMAGIDFVRWFSGAKEAYKSLKNKDSDYEELLSAGLIGTDLLKSDLMPNTEKANSLLQKSQSEKENSLGNKNWNPYKWWMKLDKGAMDIYGGADDWAKLNAYKILKEQGYSEKDAQKKIYEGFQNYATVGKAWDVASKTPVFGNPFVKFPADLMRITGNAVTKKPLSTALYLAGLYMLPQLLRQLGASEEEDDDKRELRESRPFTPKMDLGFVNIPLIYKTKIGEVNLARYMTPYFYFDNGEDGAFSSMASKFTPFKTVTMQGYGKGNEFDVPFGQDPILGTLYNIMIDTDFRGKSIQDPDATRYRASGVTDQKKFENKASNALRTWVPNGGLIQDTYLNAKYGEDFYGRTRTIAQSLINFAVKIQDFQESDYKKTAEKQLFSITNDLRSQAETIKNTAVTNARKMQKVQANFRDGKISASDYQNSLDRLQGEYQKSIEAGYKNLDELQNKRADFQKKWAKFLN